VRFLEDLVYSVCMKRSNYYLPQPLLARLAAAKTLFGLSVSEIIRNAISEYLDRRGL